MYIEKVCDKSNSPTIKIINHNIEFIMAYQGYDYFIEMYNLEEKKPIILEIPKDNILYSPFKQVYSDIKNLDLKYYNKPFENEEVIWKCDDFEENKGDIFKISKKEDFILLQMIPNYENASFGHVRIRTSGSRYGDYFMIFYRMYNELCDISINKQKLLKL